MSFFEEWFGSSLPGREIFYSDSKSRTYINKPDRLKIYVKYCTEKKIPAFVSVQPYKARNQVYGLEKLFFDFDYKEDSSKAWKDVSSFSKCLTEYYDVFPLITFSGNKGYHCYVFLNTVWVFQERNINLAKKIYETLQRKILKGLKLETLDPAVIGDIKRLARTPFSFHEKTGKLCSPLSLSHRFIKPRLSHYRKFGLNTSIFTSIIEEVKKEERWKKIKDKNKSVKFKTFSSKIRPCFQKAISLKLKQGEGHKMRLAIATEYLHKGSSIEQVVFLFKDQKDFDEKKTRYFVKDALMKDYKPFKCKTIKSLGFCLSNCPRLKKRDIKI